MKSRYLGLTGLIIFLIAWETISDFKIVDPFFISSPSKVIVSLYELFSTGDIFPHLLFSGEEFFAGFFLAIISGIILGLIISSSGYLYNLTKPFITGLYNTPRIILLPLLLIWFGFGLFSKVLLIFLIAIFPILVNTITAARNVDRSLILMARSFSASKLVIFIKVIFPSSFPYILTGINLAIGRALTGIIVGELYGSSGGIGYLASYFGQTFQIDKLIAIIIIFIIFSLLLTNAIYLLTERFNYEENN